MNETRRTTRTSAIDIVLTWLAMYAMWSLVLIGIVALLSLIAETGTMAFEDIMRDRVFLPIFIIAPLLLTILVTPDFIKSKRNRA